MFEDRLTGLGEKHTLEIRRLSKEKEDDKIEARMKKLELSERKPAFDDSPGKYLDQSIRMFETPYRRFSAVKSSDGDLEMRLRELEGNFTANREQKIIDTFEKRMSEMEKRAVDGDKDFQRNRSLQNSPGFSQRDD